MDLFNVINGNVLSVSGDLLILKHAQEFYGADKAVADKLILANICTEEDLRLKQGEFKLIDTQGILDIKRVLFIGTKRLIDFGYEEMQQFGFMAMKFISRMKNMPANIVSTVHGQGYGLDGGESLQRMVIGYLTGIAEFEISFIQKITFVTLGDRSERMLSSSLVALSQHPLQLQLLKYKDTGNFRESSETELKNSLFPPITKKEEFISKKIAVHQEDLPLEINIKKHVFVAMPFSEDFQNVYEYGIYPAVRNCDLICERVDETHFTGDILHRIRTSIETASLIIADLTESRPNVYLEVGYAWGKGIPVIFIAKKGEKLHFDVSTHRCLYYGRFAKLALDLEDLINGVGIITNR